MVGPAIVVALVEARLQAEAIKTIHPDVPRALRHGAGDHARAAQEPELVARHLGVPIVEATTADGTPSPRVVDLKTTPGAMRETQFTFGDGDTTDMHGCRNEGPPTAEVDQTGARGALFVATDAAVKADALGTTRRSASGRLVQEAADADARNAAGTGPSHIKARAAITLFDCPFQKIEGIDNDSAVPPGQVTSEYAVGIYGEVDGFRIRLNVRDEFRQ
mmetsp:Transcript_29692/g.63148  ORF Transcript_29692/g.63148 Transcript_29692/m.63148 type:complete len:219 (-) Transcript_29692:293-949(-)